MCVSLPDGATMYHHGIIDNVSHTHISHQNYVYIYNYIMLKSEKEGMVGISNGFSPPIQT